MKLKKLYKHDNKKQIWRIIPTSNNKLVIEERDNKTKEVFFNCLEIKSGGRIFVDFQLDEKSWIGIETVYNDIIFFHSYGNHEMPAHKSIIAFDIHSKNILWQNDNYVYSFIYDDIIYCYQQRFESRVYYALDHLTGNMIKEIGNDISEILQLREKANEDFGKQNYLFPEYFNPNDLLTEEYQRYLQNIKVNDAIEGDISYLKIDNLLMLNYHQISDAKNYTNIFIAVDLLKNKILLKEILDKNLVNLMPESFFVKDDILFLIVDKTKLLVYQIKE